MQNTFPQFRDLLYIVVVQCARKQCKIVKKINAIPSSNETHKLYRSCNIDILVSYPVKIGTNYKGIGSTHKFVKLRSLSLI